MSFQQEIAGQNRPAKRPATLTGLLLHRIAMNPYAENVQMDSAWSAEHVGKPRFRIGGMAWFRDITGLTGEKLYDVRKDAIREAKLSRWHEMEGVSRLVARKQEANWDTTARPQYFEAIAGKPLLLVKAAQILLSCELALDQLIEEEKAKGTPATNAGSSAAGTRPTSLGELGSGTDIYRYMAVVPACWNIGDFDEQYLKDRIGADPTFLDQLGEATGQTDHDVFRELAKGHTVTFGLARKTKTFCDQKKPVGQIRCREGQDKLGSKRAVALEEIAP